MKEQELREYLTNRFKTLATKNFTSGSEQRVEVYEIIDDLVKLFAIPDVSNSVICPNCNGKGWTVPTDRVPYDCEKCKGTGKL